MPTDDSAKTRAVAYELEVPSVSGCTEELASRRSSTAAERNVASVSRRHSQDDEVRGFDARYAVATMTEPSRGHGPSPQLKLHRDRTRPQLNYGDYPVGKDPP